MDITKRIIEKLEQLYEKGLSRADNYDFRAAIVELLESSNVLMKRFWNLDNLIVAIYELEVLDPDMLYYAEQLVDRYLTY